MHLLARLKACVHWWCLLAKLSATATRESHYYTFLGHLGQCDTDRIVSIFCHTAQGGQGTSVTLVCTCRQHYRANLCQCEHGLMLTFIDQGCNELIALSGVFNGIVKCDNVSHNDMQQQYATINTELALVTLGGTTQIEMILSVQSSWSKGISETKLKQQSPCSNCMHWPVTSWPTVGSHHRDRTYENKIKCPCGTLSKPTVHHRLITWDLKFQVCLGYTFTSSYFANCVRSRKVAKAST